MKDIALFWKFDKRWTIAIEANQSISSNEIVTVQRGDAKTKEVCILNRISSITVGKKELLLYEFAEVGESLPDRHC